MDRRGYTRGRCTAGSGRQGGTRIAQQPAVAQRRHRGSVPDGRYGAPVRVDSTHRARWYGTSVTVRHVPMSPAQIMHLKCASGSVAPCVQSQYGQHAYNSSRHRHNCVVVNVRHGRRRSERQQCRCVERRRSAQAYELKVPQVGIQGNDNVRGERVRTYGSPAYRARSRLRSLMSARVAVFVAGKCAVVVYRMRRPAACPIYRPAARGERGRPPVRYRAATLLPVACGVEPAPRASARVASLMYRSRARRREATPNTTPTAFNAMPPAFSMRRQVAVTTPCVVTHHTACIRV